MPHLLALACDRALGTAVPFTIPPSHARARLLHGFQLRRPRAMSGPSTRSHRSSVRGTDVTLAELSLLLKANRSVVMITGAGLSAASGIPTFRGGSDSVWCVTAAAQGRRSVFKRDPLRWYNEFFLKHFPMSFTRKKPNPGHEAVAMLARAFPDLRLITQNIDGLHLRTANAWPDPERVIEAHGRLGLFKCVSEVDNNNDSDSGSGGSSDPGDGGDTMEGALGGGECPYSYDKAIEPADFPEGMRAALEDGDSHTTAASGFRRPLVDYPRCPQCGEASPPMSLLFDEDYDSHSFYDFDRAEEWFKNADVIVFVGTSFAVTLTSLAIREAKRRRIPVYDFNVSVSLKASPALDAKTVLGPAEATLPALAKLAGAWMTEADTAHHDTVIGDGSGNNNNKSDGADSGKTGRTSTTGRLDKQAAGNDSVLGRRSREDDFDDDREDREPLHRRKTARLADGMGTEGGVPAVVDSSTPERVSGRWGDGAKYVLEPELDAPLRGDQVRVDLSEAYSRKAHPEAEVEATLDVIWQEQLAKNPLLFNGTKFRLAGYSTEGDHSVYSSSTAVTPAPHADGSLGTGSEGDLERGALPHQPGPAGGPPRSRSPSSPPTHMLRLRLGLTDYRTFRGTNWSPMAARLVADSARDFPWLEGAYLSQKLGVGAIVETADGHLVSLRRSSGVAEGQGMMGAPGGHPEPENLGLTAEALKALSAKRPSSRLKLARLAKEELFDSAVQEVVDETNVPRSALGEPLLSGIVRQANSFGAPTAAFIIPCSLERTAVLNLYAQGAKEAFESTDLRTIPSAEIVNEGSSAWFASRGLRATPSFEGALELWRAHRLRGVA